MEVIVIDGDPRPVRVCQIGNHGSSYKTIDSIHKVVHHSVTASLMTTKVMDTPDEIDRIHISHDDKLYELCDVSVSGRNLTVGKQYSEIELTANKMSVRRLTTRLK